MLSTKKYSNRLNVGIPDNQYWKGCCTSMSALQKQRYDILTGMVG